MKIDNLLSTLNYSYYPSNDEIIVAWFDKNDVSKCLDTLPDDEDVLDEAWSRVSEDIQDTLNGWIDAHGLQYTFAGMLQSAIEDVQEEWGKDDE